MAGRIRKAGEAVDRGTGLRCLDAQQIPCLLSAASDAPCAWQDRIQEAEFYESGESRPVITKRRHATAVRLVELEHRRYLLLLSNDGHKLGPSRARS